MLSFATAPYAVRVHSAADALAKVAVMRRYNAAHNQNGNAFTDVCLVRAAPLRCARCADAPLRRTAALQAMASSPNGAAVKAAIDLPEGAGWTNDNRFAFTAATPELVIQKVLTSTSRAGGDRRLAASAAKRRAAGAPITRRTRDFKGDSYRPCAL